MLFNTVEFVFFFIFIVALYWMLNRSWQNILLLAASYFFYGCWDFRFLSLIAISTVIDYIAGIKIYESTDLRKRKIFLILSMFTNLTLLGFFKYFDFFADNMQVLLESIGIKTSVGRLRIILPVGISFYTFQTMSYTIDIYKGGLKPTRHFLDFALFVAFFPQLVAGPIERAVNLLPQVLRKRTFSHAQFLEGLQLMVWGFFKKMVVADNMARIVDYIFTLPPERQTGFELLLGLGAFAFQIYGDFSGYSDIARGSAKCMGFDLMVNFKRPYLSISPSEFWTRWHISLSSWLRDYLYITFGGNKKGTLLTYRNLFLTMLLGGLWHGAGWNFIAWGAFHGFVLAFFRFLNWGTAKEPPPKTKLAARIRFAYRWPIMIGLNIISLPFFRAENMTHAIGIFSTIFSFWKITPLSLLFLKEIIFFCGFLVVVDVWEYLQEGKEKPYRLSFLARFTFYVYCIASILYFGVYEAHQFIYFQF